MNRNLVFISALSVGLMTTAGIAQGAPAASAPSPTATAVAPQPIPAKIALVAFEQAVFATNEGQRAVQAVQQKYAPKKEQIEALSQQVDALKKDLQGAPATMTDEQRSTKLKSIDSKEKELNRQAEDAQTAYNADLQDAYGKVAKKVSVALKDYVAKNGYTLLLDVSNQQSNVMWAVPSTDVTKAVVEAYNVSSGVAAPVPSAPSAPSAPAASRPHPATAPKK